MPRKTQKTQPPGPPGIERDLAFGRGVLDALYGTPDRTAQELAADLGARHQNVTWSLRRYWAFGYVTRRRDAAHRAGLPGRKPFRWALTVYGRKRVEAWRANGTI